MMAPVPNPDKKAPGNIQATTHVYCPLCTHTVDASVTYAGKIPRVTPGQKCSHCGSSIDAGFVLDRLRAA
jgi:DNA-directed RNA polymerase subunit RPC12/RpoP